MSQTVKLVDGAGAAVAVAQITRDRDLFSGSVDLRAMPQHMLRKFEQFEEFVNDQVFSLVDEIQEEIVGLDLKAVFDNGCTEALDDLQIYPSDGVLSFKLKSAVTAAAAPAHGNGRTRNQ